MSPPWEIVVEVRMDPETAERLAALLRKDDAFELLVEALEGQVELHRTRGCARGALVLVPRVT